MLLIGSRHRCQSCSEATRFARSGASQPTRRSTSTSRTPLLGFIDHPSVDTTVLRPHPIQAVAWTSIRDCHVPNVFRSCRSSRLQRFPPQRSDPKIRSFDGPRVCCTPQPTMGFTTFRTPWKRPLDRTPTRRSMDPKVRGESSPVAKTLRSVPLLGSLAMPSPRCTLSGAVAFTDWRSLSPFEPCPLPCRHGALLCSSTSGLSSAEESVAFARRCRCAPARCSLGLWIDSFRCCRAFRATPSGDGTFRLAAQPLRRPPTRTSREGNGVSALSGSARRKVLPSPKGWLRSVAMAPAPPEGDASAASTMGPEGLWGCQWIHPERRSTASVRAPEGEGLPTSSRRISEETRTRPSARSEERQPVVRARARHPSAVARVHDGETARRGRLHPKVCASARHSRAPRRGRRRTHQPRSRRTRPMGETGGPPGGVPLRTRGSGVSSKLEGRLGPDSHRVHRDGRCAIRRSRRPFDPEIGESAPKRRGCGWCRTTHLWW